MMRREHVAAVLAAAAAVLLGSCGSDDGGAEGGGEGNTSATADPPLRVEAAEGPRGTEVIVYINDAALNKRATAGGKAKVNLRCFDKGRTVIVEKPHPWPFTDTDNGLTDAHVHQRVARTKAGQVSGCELGGTRGPLRGELVGSGFE